MSGGFSTRQLTGTASGSTLLSWIAWNVRSPPKAIGRAHPFTRGKQLSLNRSPQSPEQDSCRREFTSPDIYYSISEKEDLLSLLLTITLCVYVVTCLLMVVFILNFPKAIMSLQTSIVFLLTPSLNSWHPPRHCNLYFIAFFRLLSRA